MNGIETTISISSEMLKEGFIYFQARDGIRDNQFFAANIAATNTRPRGFFADLAYWALDGNSTIKQADNFYILIKNKPSVYRPYVRILHKPGYNPGNLITWIHENIGQLKAYGLNPGIQMQEAKVYSLETDANSMGGTVLQFWNDLKSNSHLWVVPAPSPDLTKLSAIWKPDLMQVAYKTGYNLITTDITTTTPPTPPTTPPPTTDTLTAEEIQILKKICKGFIT